MEDACSSVQLTAEHFPQKLASSVQQGGWERAGLSRVVFSTYWNLIVILFFSHTVQNLNLLLFLKNEPLNDSL